MKRPVEKGLSGTVEREHGRSTRELVLRAVMALTMQIGGLELARGCRRVRAVLGIAYERTEKQREATQDFRKNGFFYGKMHKRAAISRMAALFTSQTLVIGRPEKQLY